eukprot:TRINITY_DN3793_c0_g1_i1.p1 TRINITY_DN3793_c0_g1~~TRINITY_DN3793_c0_g1_i1.p1  ORF type:complete len:1011 (+),score=411.60 TRINITY_DN3793_c0_g1_i1:290-3322(+)
MKKGFFSFLRGSKEKSQSAPASPSVNAASSSSSPSSPTLQSSPSSSSQDSSIEKERKKLSKEEKKALKKGAKVEAKNAINRGSRSMSVAVAPGKSLQGSESLSKVVESDLAGKSHSEFNSKSLVKRDSFLSLRKWGGKGGKNYGSAPIVQDEEMGAKPKAVVSDPNFPLRRMDSKGGESPQRAVRKGSMRRIAHETLSRKAIPKSALIYNGILEASEKESGNDRLRFGIPLEKLIENGRDLPVMFMLMVSRLEAKALETPGIFFFDTENALEVQSLRELVEKGKLEINQVLDVHLLAGLLKSFLSELPEPLMTFDLYESFMFVADHLKDKEEQISSIRSLVYQLPLTHRMTLQYLLSLLLKFQEHSSKNHMNVVKLSKAFGPICLKSPVASLDTPKQMMQQCPQILQHLMNHYDRIFLIKEGADLKFTIKNGIPIVRLSTIDNILLSIVDPFSKDKELMGTIASCYDYFISKEELLQKLGQIHEKNENHEDERYKTKKKDKMGLFLNIWIKFLKKYSEINGEFGENLRRFSNNWPEAVRRIDNSSSPSPISISRTISMSLGAGQTSEIDILSIGVSELSKQMALTNQGLFFDIDTKECLHKHFMEASKSPTFTEITLKVNSWSEWVATEVLKREVLQERVDSIVFFIKVAESSKELKDYIGCCSVIAGLSISSVARLKQTWARVPKPLMAKFVKLIELFDMTKNYKNYREDVAKVSPPLVPYIVLYPKYLFGIEENNPGVIEGLINVTKYRLIYQQMLEIENYQKDPFPFENNVKIARQLANLKPFDSERLFTLSNKLEPRDSKRVDVTTNPLLAVQKRSTNEKNRSSKQEKRDSNPEAPEKLTMEDFSSVERTMASSSARILFKKWLEGLGEGKLINFWEEAERFSQLEDQNALIESAQKIFEQYFSKESSNFIELSEENLQNVEEMVKFKVFNSQSYERAKKEVEITLGDKFYGRFLLSDSLESLFKKEKRESGKTEEASDDSMIFPSSLPSDSVVGMSLEEESIIST